MTDKEAERQLKRDIVSLLNQRPFYGHILISMEKIANSKAASTAMVSMNGQQLVLHTGPDYASREKEHRYFILVHEVYHVIARHLTRLKDLRRSNRVKGDIAIDLATDQNIVTDPFLRAPQDAHFPERFNLERGHTAEWYYDHLSDDLLKRVLCADCMLRGTCPGPAQLGEEICNDSCLDTHEPFPTNIPVELQEAIIMRIAQTAKKKVGSVPGELESFLTPEEVKPLPLRQYMERFMTASQGRLSFSKKGESKRYHYPPKVKIKPRGKGVVSIDVSGSISDHQLAYFLGIVNHRAQEQELALIEVDAEVSHIIDPYTPSHKVKIKGRGGTKFVPVFEKVKSLYMNKIDWLIYLTDGWNYDEYELSKYPKPPYPVLWIVIYDRTFPFGDKIILDLNEERGQR